METDMDEVYMREAIRQAKKAYAKEETPIGCVIVRGERIIARGYNKRNEKKKHTRACGDPCDSQGKPCRRGLAAGGLHDVCHA